MPVMSNAISTHASSGFFLIKRIIAFWRERRITLWLVFFLLIYGIGILKLSGIDRISDNWLFGLYSFGVSTYILSRFGLAYFHVPEKSKFDPHYLPTISFGIPSKNEGENIRETIVRIAQSDYPKDKFDIIAINDGSTDNTLAEMYAAQKIAKEMGVTVTVINWRKNRGKRDGMAECAYRSSGDLIVYIDSDSFVEPSTARELAKYFVDPKVAAVAGHGFVANEEANYLTKMQAVRYFVAFKAYKGSESLFGSVTCCSGCCSAYRRSALLEIIDPWLKQKFLGVQCTYGDDRSLTNFLLRRNYSTLYAPEAIAYTIVPDTLSKFMKQQLRWKKSWIRENTIAATFMWKRNIVTSLSFYLGFILPLVAPAVVVRALMIQPIANGILPFAYIIGLGLMATIYGLYYYIYTGDRKWTYGVLFATFYTLVLIWQLPYAIISLRDGRWGTR
jgi:hyaluronan synthase